MREIRSGVWPVMITPFDEADRLDEKALRYQIDWYIAHGCVGLFAVCQSSEMFYLSLEERIRLASLCVQYAAGRVPVIAAGSISQNAEERLKETECMLNTGIDVFVLLTSVYATADESDGTWMENVDAVLARFPEARFGLYECPHPYHRLLSDVTLDYIVRTGRFEFIKDTCCDIETIGHRLKRLSGSKIRLFNANTLTLLESLRLGADGFCGLMANCHPELYDWLIRHFQEEPEKAEILQGMLTLLSAAEGQSYPVSAKQHMIDEGIPMTLNTRCMSLDQLKEKHIRMLRQSERIERLLRDELLKEQL